MTHINGRSYKIHITRRYLTHAASCQGYQAKVWVSFHRGKDDFGNAEPALVIEFETGRNCLLILAVQ